MTIIGPIIILIHAPPPDTTDKETPTALPIKVDVVNSNEPMPISHEWVKRATWPIDFRLALC